MMATVAVAPPSRYPFLHFPKIVHCFFCFFLQDFDILSSLHEARKVCDAQESAGREKWDTGSVGGRHLVGFICK